MKMMAFKIFVYLVAVCLFVMVYGQEGEDQDNNNAVSLACLGCICDAVSECNATIGCSGDICGPFKMTLSFWSDGGKPTINNEESTDDDNDFTECANDAYCAGRAVNGYMDKYAQDCNGDGVIDCADYARIHKLGAFGCTADLDEEFEDTFNDCIKVFE